METSGIMDNFALPANVEASGAREMVNKLTFKNLDNGVAVMSGHEAGTPYRFLKVAIFNGWQPKTKEEELKARQEGKVWSDSNIERECVMPVYDDADAVEFICSRYRHPVQLVKHLNRERMRFGIDGEIIGGTMAEDYKRWKGGLGPSGHSLELWHEITPGILKTLNSQNVFTVEQFASMSRDKVKEIFPKNIQIIFEHLVDYVAGKDAVSVAAEYESRIKALEVELSAAKEKANGMNGQSTNPWKDKKYD
jgi:hypothetical protein